MHTLTNADFIIHAPLNRAVRKSILAAAVIASGMLSHSWSAEIIVLGAAQDFAVLGGSTVTNTGSTVIVGNLGLSPGSAVTGFPPGMLVSGTVHINDALSIQAHTDAFAAFTQIAGEAGVINLTGVDLGGLTLVPGVYHFDSSAQLTGALNLNTGGDPNAAFHFQIGSTLTTAANSTVNLLGLLAGAAANIFWSVGSSATLGTDTAFEGNIVALQSITFNTGADLNGRALAVNGAVTLDANNINSALIIAGGRFWKGNAGNLWSGANWSPNVSGATSGALEAAADVVFSVTGVVPQNQNTTLDTNAVISSLTVNDGVAVTISGPNTLSINGTGATRGININSGAGLTTINSRVELSGLSQPVTVNNAAGLVLNGALIGNVGLTKDGTGQLTLAGANAYTGATAVVQGTLLAGAANVIPSLSAVSVNTGSVLNLNGFAQNVGSIAGAGAITLGTAALVTGNDGSSTIFNGIISGTGSVQKVGSGTWTLGGANAYTGATRISVGTLQAGATNVVPISSAVVVSGGVTFHLDNFNQSIGSLAGAGAVTLGTATLVTGNDNSSTEYSGIISGPGSVQKVGTGTWTLSGANTYAGLTTLSAGTLAVNGSIAGNVLVSGGTLRGVGTINGNFVNNAAVNPGRIGSPGRLTVVGNFSQGAPGALNIRIASPTSFDRLVVGGSAALGGALNVSSTGGFTAKPGDVIPIVTAGSVSGKFANVSGAQPTSTVTTFGVSYRTTGVSLEFAQGSFAAVVPVVAPLTTTELAVAVALDKLADGGQASSELIDHLNTLPISQVPGALNLLSAQDLTAIFTAGLSTSKVQASNIERRLQAVRQQGTFSDYFDSTTSDSRGARNYEGQSARGRSGKTVIPMDRDGKGSRELEPPRDERDRWGYFISGTGEWGDLESVGPRRGTSFTTAGVTVGADYRVNRNVVIGAALGYANTSSDLNRGGDMDIDSGKASLYATYHKRGFYLDAIVGGGYSSIDTSRRTVGGFAVGKTEAADFNALLGTGYDFRAGRFTIGPIASVRYSSVGLDAFSERGALGAMHIDSQSQDSLESATGLRASYTMKLGEAVVTPEVRAQWMHEYLASNSSIDAGFTPGNSFAVHGPDVGRDALLLDVGITAQLKPNVSLFSNYSTELGRENYSIQSISAGVRVSF